MRTDGRILIATAGVLYGTVTVGGSFLSKQGLTPLDISFFFLLFSLIPLLPLVAKRSVLSNIASAWRYLTLYSLVSTALLLSQFGSIALGLAPAITALLLYTQPIWTIFFGRLFFSERVDRSRIGIIALALCGAVLVTDPAALFLQFQSGNAVHSSTLLAELVALSGGVFLSLWIILGKKGRLGALNNPAALTFAVRAGSCIPIAILGLSSLSLGLNFFFVSPSNVEANLRPLFAFAMIAGLLPDYLFYVGVEKVQSLQAGIILLLEPVSSAVLSAVLLIASLGPTQIAGGALILASNYLVVKSSGKTEVNMPK